MSPRGHLIEHSTVVKCYSIDTFHSSKSSPSPPPPFPVPLRSDNDRARCRWCRRSFSSNADSDSRRSLNSARNPTRKVSSTHVRRKVSNWYRLDSLRLMRFAGAIPAHTHARGQQQQQCRDNKLTRSERTKLPCPMHLSATVLSRKIQGTHIHTMALRQLPLLHCAPNHM